MSSLRRLIDISRSYNNSKTSSFKSRRFVISFVLFLSVVGGVCAKPSSLPSSTSSPPTKETESSFSTESPIVPESTSTEEVNSPLLVSTDEKEVSPPKEKSSRLVLDSSSPWSASGRLPSSSISGSTSSARRHTTNTWTASSRRLHSPKWGNDETMKNDQSATGSSDASKTNNNNRNAPLVESLSAMASNLLMNDNSVEVSSERDVFVNDHKNNNNNDVSPEEESPEGNSSEESSADGNATSSPEDFKDDEDEDDDELLVEDNPRQKSDAVTTPQGLTTWSELQNLPSDSTVSSTSLLFADKEKQQQQQQQHEASSPLRTTLFANPFITTEIPRTTKSAVAKTKPTTGVKRKPYNKNKKVVLPNRFVKPALEEVTAEAVGTDATHTIYKVTSTSNQNSKQESKEGPGTNNNNPYGTTKRPFPIWPYQTTTRRALPIAPKRPPFYKPTKAKTPMGVKRPSSPSSSSFTSASTSVTTTPTPTTTVYNRIPSPVMYPFGPISFTNLGFMDFLRSQILPRIGLSLISFMAASPLILSMLGANALGRRRRRRRSVSLERRNTSPVSAQNIPYDFAALEKKFKSIQNESKNEWPLLTKAFDFLIHKFTSSLTSQFQKKNSS